MHQSNAQRVVFIFILSLISSDPTNKLHFFTWPALLLSPENCNFYLRSRLKFWNINFMKVILQRPHSISPSTGVRDRKDQQNKLPFVSKASLPWNAFCILEAQIICSFWSFCWYSLAKFLHESFVICLQIDRFWSVMFPSISNNTINMTLRTVIKIPYWDIWKEDFV